MDAKIRVLLVDDEVDFINMMQYWLQKRNFKVDVLYDGSNVVEAVKNNNYNIMFLDLRLPVHDGIEILRNIRAFNKTIPVIIFSAYGTKENIKEATELGISGFFAKEKGFEEAARLIYTAIRIHRNVGRTKEGDKNAA
ncbi:MAG: response regulator [Candidatus Omnitrophica bacterium]|nr:response regulator [Candidatus Omnitrophota bacterium]MBU1925816.1 response regulator [Candidatus Omnitrophota bacterium]MBU2063619.1 response regulator [Candidatus Omnitrophota bacterium]